LRYYGTQEASKRILPTSESVSADMSGLEKLMVFSNFQIIKKTLYLFALFNDRNVAA
jgi:hypothetical protein